MKKEKYSCYNCDKELELNEEYWYQVIEDMSDAECPPEAAFCKECFLKISEPDY